MGLRHSGSPPLCCNYAYFDIPCLLTAKYMLCPQKASHFCYNFKIVNKFSLNFACSCSNEWWTVCIKTTTSPDLCRLRTLYRVILQETSKCIMADWQATFSQNSRFKTKTIRCLK